MLLKPGHRQFAVLPQPIGGAPREKNYCPPAGVPIALERFLPPGFASNMKAVPIPPSRRQLRFWYGMRFFWVGMLLLSLILTWDYVRSGKFPGPLTGVLIAAGNLMLSPVQGHSWASWAAPSQKIQAIAGFMLLGGSLAVSFYSPGRG